MKIKRLFQVLGIGALTCFSFYYTHQIVAVSNNVDPIMQQINEVYKELEINPIDANIEGDTITSGVCGLAIDKDTSYHKMKKLGEFNKNLLMYTNVLPNVSIKNHYDKYLLRGSPKKRSVAITFVLEDNKNNQEIFEILRKKNIKATFFLDGKYGEENKEFLKNNLDVMNLENYGYNKTYDKTKIDYTSRLITQITTNKSKYCLAQTKDENILNTCQNAKHYTILPTPIKNNSPYISVKEELKNGSILNLENNNYTVQSLEQIINFITQKGYDIVSLDELLSEC